MQYQWIGRIAHINVSTMQEILQKYTQYTTSSIFIIVLSQMSVVNLKHRYSISYLILTYLIIEKRNKCRKLLPSLSLFKSNSETLLYIVRSYSCHTGETAAKGKDQSSYP